MPINKVISINALMVITFFLDSISWNMLKEEYLEEAEFPEMIEGRIKNISSFTLTEQTLQRHRHMIHLPLGSIVSVCEIEMRDLVKPEVYSIFQELIHHKESQRKSERKRSDKMVKEIAKNAKLEADQRLLKLYGLIDWDGEYKATKISTSDLNEFPDLTTTPPVQEEPEIEKEDEEQIMEVKKNWNIVAQKGLGATEIEELWPTLDSNDTTKKKIAQSPKRKKKKGKKKNKRWKKLDLGSPQLESKKPARSAKISAWGQTKI